MKKYLSTILLLLVFLSSNIGTVSALEQTLSSEQTLPSKQALSSLVGQDNTQKTEIPIQDPPQNTGVTVLGSGSGNTSSVLIQDSLSGSLGVQDQKTIVPSSPSSILFSSGSSLSGVASSGSTKDNRGIVDEQDNQGSHDISNDQNGENDEDTEDDILDLGDSKTEDDLQKDFTAIVRQSKDYTCGPAALATLRTQLGEDTTEEEVLSLIDPKDISTESGVTLLSLREASTKLGGKTFLKKWTPEQILEYIHQTQDPVLIHDEKKGVGGHFSVIREYDETKGLIELSDTEAGNIKYSIEDFRHIYTGYALIISDDITHSLLSDTSTDLSDTEAGTIWGKYVPVTVYARENKYNNAIDIFRLCQSRALSQPTAAMRTTERKICYDRLASNLGTAMDNTAELKFMTSYNISDNRWNTVNQTDSEFGLNTMLSILNSKLSANKGILNTKQSLYNSKALQYDTTVNKNPILLSRQASYNTNITNKTILENQVKQKQSTYDRTYTEVFMGTFTQNGQIFYLGTVGSQLQAQSSTYARLSANLSSRLSSLDGQIRQIQAQLNNANNQYNTYNSQYNSYQSSVANYKNIANYYYSLYISSRINKQYNLNIYNQYSALARNVQSSANAALSNRNYYGSLVSSYRNQINTLNSQKQSAKTEVNNASAEKARLERLKVFGDQEIQRKKTLLSQLFIEIAGLNTQLTKTNTVLAQAEKDISTLKDTLATANVPLKREIDTLQSEISALMIEIRAQEQEISNEATNQKIWNDSAEIGATQEMRYAPGIAINNGVEYIKQNPWTVVKMGGVTVIMVGGAIVCAATAPVCATALGYGGAIASGGFIVNGVKVVTTGSNIFGTPVSDAEWGNAVVMLPVDIALGLSGPLLKVGLRAKYGVEGAENIGATLVRGGQAEKAMAVEAVRASGVVGKVIARANLSKGVQDSLINLEKNGWQRNWQYAANGSKFENRLGDLPIKSDLLYYKEYDIYVPKSPSERGLERFIRGAGGEVYYTSNHYGDIKDGNPPFYLIIQ